MSAPLKSILSQIVNHDSKLYLKKGGDLTYIIGFSVIVLTLFPLAFGADNPLTGRYGPALIWVVALLASLMSLPSIFGRDAADGSLDQLRLSGATLEWCVLGKAFANWACCQLPLVLASPLFCLVLGVPQEQAARAMLSLLLGTPVLSLIGSLGGALTLAATRGSGIIAILVLPLYIPVLIFGSLLSLKDAALPAFGFNEAWFLLAILLMALPACCWGSASILRAQD